MLRVYEIQNIGKGVITEILPENLLLTNISLKRYFPTNKVVSINKNLIANEKNFFITDFDTEYTLESPFNIVVLETIDAQNKVQVPVKLGKFTGTWYYSVAVNVLSAEIHILVKDSFDSYQSF